MIQLLWHNLDWVTGTDFVSSFDSRCHKKGYGLDRWKDEDVLLPFVFRTVVVGPYQKIWLVSFPGERREERGQRIIKASSGHTSTDRLSSNAV
jgi:hypothetical protein